MVNQKKKRIKLSEINSHRGLGRSILLGGGIMPGAIAGYVGKKAAEEADEQGLSDWEIKKAATNKGAKAGGLGSGLSGAAIGALGGYLGAEKNTRTRLKKRRDMENSMR